MDNYEFQSHWTPTVHSLPLSGMRCIVTDGDTIVVGTYADPVWILDGIGQGCGEYKVIGWMPVPKPMHKTVSYNEMNVGKN